jgi:MDMPI C-terminal domain
MDLQPDRTAGFWLRKMLHDEVIHRFDAELAGGGLGDVAPQIAIDGVSDWLESVATLSQPGAGEPVFRGLVGAGETLQFQATNPGVAAADGWYVTRSPAGVVWRRGYESADALVRAPVRELLLMLYRRLDTGQDGVEIVGERGLFTHWLEHSKF